MGLAYIGEVATIEGQCGAGACRKHVAVPDMAAVGRFLGIASLESAYPTLVHVDAPAAGVGSRGIVRSVALENGKGGKEKVGTIESSLSV